MFSKANYTTNELITQFVNIPKMQCSTKLITEEEDRSLKWDTNDFYETYTIVFSVRAVN